MKKIEDKDKNHIFGFIKRFRNHSDDIKILEEKLKSLQEEKNKALNDLNRTREDEKKFTRVLCEKYGNGHFDITNLDYWILD